MNGNVFKMDNNYSNSLRAIIFSDSSDNFHSMAKNARNELVYNYFSSIKFGENENTICHLLQQNLDTYSEIVDNPDGVNNYAGATQELISTYPLGHRHQWNYSLKTEDLLSFITPLSCSSELNCSKSGITEEDVRLYIEARNNFTSVRPSVKRTLASNFTPKETFRRVKPPLKPIKEQERLKTIKNEMEPTTQNKDTPADFAHSFKTAGEELRIQNAKKLGTSGNTEQYNYGVVKKTLGHRRGGGINNKFQPPILKPEEPEEKQPTEYGELNNVDERLKNIDPKMIEIIRNEIMDCGPKITWDDIAGLDFAKTTIQEIVVWPMLRPDIFTGLRRPPKGILLFGPPGTGKTLIGKCIASQSGATFLSISASSLTSKWVGDGEKMVRALFAVARVKQPAVVFIDEIDSLLSQRSDTEHESSRRIKTEFLVQLDGVGTGEEDRILIIGATNRPQELDEAARRRLVKRLYIPLPEMKARMDMVKKLISSEKHTLTDDEIEEIAGMTDGYSGADVKVVCQEASLGPIRSIPPSEIQNLNLNQVRPVNISDFKSALQRVKSTVSPSDLNSYVKWDQQFGCGHKAVN